MMKSFAVLALLAMTMAVSYGSDWLVGGNVGQGNNGEIQQYFTDPIFFYSSARLFAQTFLSGTPERD